MPCPSFYLLCRAGDLGVLVNGDSQPWREFETPPHLELT